MGQKINRIEIHPKTQINLDSINEKINAYLDLDVPLISRSKVYWVQSSNKLHPQVLNKISNRILCDDIIENVFTSETPNYHYDCVLEISFKPGVTDNTAHSTKDAIKLVTGLDLEVYTGELFFIKGDLSKENILKIGKELLGNNLLNSYHVYLKDEFNNNRFKENKVAQVKLEKHPTQKIDIFDNFENLQRMNFENCWALNDSELKQIINYYQKPEVIKQRKEKGLDQLPTDVEIEVIAQSWSEHCKHKIFAANINYQEIGNPEYKKIGSKKINSLYKSYIKKATHDIEKSRELDWLISVFSDNAGIVRFDKNIDLCIKVETHNSPSALDPYGGALTGILGVNRDILGCGIGAKPIANTDVFCFADESIIDKGVKLPKGLMHPKRILDGVHKGVEDGGNKSGIPTVNGSIFFDDDYAGKPLVYVGTVGAMPQSNEHYSGSHVKEQKPGDLIVMVGGRIGADGIHGATFSSLELNEDSPATAVQIGDPFTQKKVMDFLVEARDNGLFTSVTDNGAGGLSSSIGEMAEVTNGASIDLSLAPVKYEGLSAFELMISESQERMSFAVNPKKIDDFQKLARKFNVESTILGEFNDSGFLTINYENELVGSLNLDFLHNSLMPMELDAVFDVKKSRFDIEYWHKKDLKEDFKDLEMAIKTILARPSIKSKEELVRQYDHEVQGATVVKPFTGKKANGPSDAGVIWLAPHGGEETNAIAISNGLQPLYSHQDTYLMSIASIDEAVRNIVATGANPDKAVLLDNFCWPDPCVGTHNPDYAHKMAKLVRACEGLYDCATLYGMPFVSGKDSMKNDFRGKTQEGEDIKISVPPTLLITAMGQIEKVEQTLTSDFKSSDDLIYTLGNFEDEKFTFSEFTRTFNKKVEKHLEFNLEENLDLYRTMYNNKNLINSCHDISEGGLITALVESSIGGQLGANLTLNPKNLDAYLFNEGLGQFVISIKKENKQEFETLFKGNQFQQIGSLTEEKSITINKDFKMSLNDLEKSWKGL